MAEHIDKEIGAIRVVLRTLEALPADIRTSVLGYVIKRLQIPVARVQEDAIVGAAISTTFPRLGLPEASSERQALPTHIKALKESKRPRSANEMAALVAYYLANVVPQKDRKDQVTAKDIETYFKIAEFPLPQKPQFTLPNAKAAGYLDAAGNGEYKLNAVGYNLVVHSMPRGADDKGPSKRRPAKKTRRSVKKRR